MTLIRISFLEGEHLSNAIYWFNNDLRLSDNPALSHALCREPVIGFVYCFDPKLFSTGRFLSKSMGAIRYRFLRESIDCLDAQLNLHGQHLNVYYQHPVKLIKQLYQDYKVTRIYVSVHAGYYERKTIGQVQHLIPDIEFIRLDTHTLYKSDELPFPINDLPATFSKFRKLIEQSDLKVAAPMPRPYDFSRPLIEKKEWRAALPDYASSTGQFKGGERAGLVHLTQYFSQNHAQTYKHTRNVLDEWGASTKFSPWLAHGCISPKHVAHLLKQHESRKGANESTYWIYFELLWREYFQWYAHKHSYKLFTFKGIQNSKPLTSFYDERYQRWCQGNTLYPIVNACMKQLNATGYMSNRGRQLVASCFVNELKLDWRYGAAYFEEQLVDYDVASNWGNWQYLAGTGADPRGLRHFNLEKQTEIYDPQKIFINKWKGNDTCLSHDAIDAVGWPLEPPIEELS